MTIQEFLDKVAELDIDVRFRRSTNPNKYYSSEQWVSRSYETGEAQKITADDVVYYEWETGGAGGGNCWGDDARGYTSNKTDPGPKDLIKILEVVCPNITLLKFNRVTDGLMLEDSRTEHEYYGNYTNYALKYFQLQELYDRLVREGVITDEAES